MTAPMTPPAYIWLMSGYDKTWHVFLDEQFADPTRPFLAALCEHTAPASCAPHACGSWARCCASGRGGGWRIRAMSGAARTVPATTPKQGTRDRR